MQRRIYDAINVMISLGLLSKNSAKKDNENIYSLVPKTETYLKKIAKKENKLEHKKELARKI